MSEDAIIRQNARWLEFILSNPEELPFKPGDYNVEFVIPFAHSIEDGKLFLTYNTLTGAIMPPTYAAGFGEYSRIDLRIRTDKTLSAGDEMRSGLVRRLKSIGNNFFDELMSENRCDEFIHLAPKEYDRLESKPGDIIILKSVERYNNKLGMKNAIKNPQPRLLNTDYLDTSAHE